MEWLLILFGAAVILGGSVSGLVAFVRLSELSRKVGQLQASVDALSSPSVTAVRTRASSAPANSAPAEKVVAETTPSLATGPRRIRTGKPAQTYPIITRIQENWMVWLGGACVALAGVFMVRYSIEQGLLGPAARFVAGLLIGLVLHIAAESLRRRTGQTHAAFAALAGAGSITLFASLFAALHLYELIAPGTAFVLMAIVALATMGMAYIHGPTLAGFGMLGAYLVPALVSSGGGQLVVVLIYALIITASAMLLLRYVYRQWLFWGAIVGAVMWWMISLSDSTAGGFRPFYLCILAYLLTSMTRFDWRLQAKVTLPSESYSLRSVLDGTTGFEKQLPLAFTIMAICYVFTIRASGDFGAVWMQCLPLLLLSFVITRSREQLFWLPWALILAQIDAFLTLQLKLVAEGWRIELLDPAQGQSFLLFLAVTALITSGLALWNLNNLRYKAAWASLATLAPMLLLTIGYLLTTDLFTNWMWSLTTVMVACGYLILATGSLKRQSLDSLVVWFFVGGHYGLAAAAAMMLDEASLTLALAAQILSIAWLINTFSLPSLGWLLKLIVCLVLLRLTANPWLVAYPAEIHWPLWTYGGSTLMAVAGTYLLRGHKAIGKWAEGAALHLFVLTIWAETRYLLHDGVVFAAEFSLVEATIYVTLFASLALVYYRRSLVSERLAQVYLWFSYVLCAMALANYGAICLLTLVSNPWVYSDIGATPVANMVIATFGLPVVLAAVFWFSYLPQYRRYVAAFFGISLFGFVSIEVRHLWQHTVQLDSPPVSAGELYTYSAMWLLLAVAAVLGGVWRLGQDCYRAGMVLLAIVIGKLFFIDMSDLTGLLRVASFMGLGLSLLAVSYLHQRLQKSAVPSP